MHALQSALPGLSCSCAARRCGFVSNAPPSSGSTRLVVAIRRLALVVAVRHDRRHSVLDPVGHPVRPKVVQQKNFGFERRLVRLPITGAKCFVIAGPNPLKQILVIEEDPFVPPRK